MLISNLPVIIKQNLKMGLIKNNQNFVKNVLSFPFLRGGGVQNQKSL